MLAIAFGILLDRKQDVAAVIEWTIAFGYTLYLLTFWWDLHQSKYHSRGELAPQRVMVQKYRNANDGFANTPFRR